MIAEMLADSIAMLEQSGSWQPLWAISLQRQDRIIRIRFHVSHGGKLELDRDRVHPAPNYGFQFADNSGATPDISSVALEGGNGVVNLSSARQGRNLRLRYAWLNDLNKDGWAGGRGQLMTVAQRPSPFALMGFEIPRQVRHCAVRFEEPC